MTMEARQVADHIKKGHAINAPAGNWISGHALLNQELLEMLDKARDGLEVSSPLARQRVKREIDDYLKEWKR